MYIFKTCFDIGLYPIVDNSSWVLNLAKYGVKTIQLRIKNQDMDFVESEIKRSIKIANENSVRLFINDYWYEAIKYKAQGVHLGQEDLLNADIKALWQSGLMLGVSTYSHAELANAIKHNPSYIALGPIFPTTTKIMQVAPQGIERLQEWKNILSCPVVAIGGINLQNIEAILAIGHKDIALIGAITTAKNPELVTKLLLKMINNAT